MTTEAISNARSVLQEEEDGVSVPLILSSVDDEIRWRESTLRAKMSYIIMSLFAGSNFLVYILIFILLKIDSHHIGVTPGYLRVVSENTIIAVIGGTVVQLGAIALSLSKWLFPSRDN